MSPITTSLQKLFSRDLNKLYEEISSYQNEADIWQLKGDIKNTAGNLALHLCGNLQHFVGAILGGSGYKRDRENEFAARDIAREQLLTEISQTKEIVLKTLESLDDQAFKAQYPQESLGYPMTTEYFLIHLSGHLMYHLGQINYHRRLIAH